MDIDLSTYTSPEEASQLDELANAFGSFARGFGGLAKAFFDAQATKEVIAAQDYTYTAIDQFQKALNEDTSIDYTKYPELWQEQKAKIAEEAGKKLTLQQSKDTYTEWAMVQFNAQGDAIANLVNKRAVALAEAQVTVSVDNAVRLGNEAAVMAYYKDAVRGGIFTGEQAMSGAQANLPKARYNNVINELSKWGDPGKAAAALLADTDGKTFRIDETQRLQAAEHFQSVADQRKKLADSISEEDGKKYWDEYSQKRLEGGFANITDMTMYAPLVDKAHRETVRRDIEAYKAGLEHTEEFKQDAFQDQLISQVWDWAANAPVDSKVPWNDESLKQFLFGTLAADGSVELPKLREDNYKKIQEAIKEADAARDDPQSSAMYSRLYSAMDSNRNPALEVPISEIDRTIQDPTKHQALLAKRNELQNSYESKRDTTKESVLLEGYDVVYSNTRSEQAKNKWVDDHVGNGLSPEDGNKLRGWVKPYNDIPARKNAMDSITEAYRISMTNAPGEEKKLALELYNARNAMEKLFLDPNTTQAVIDDAVTSFLTDRAVKDFNEVLSRATGGAGFPADLLKAGRARELETARELGVLEQFPKTAAEFATSYRETALQQERNALERAKIVPAGKSVNALGDMEYSTATGEKYVVRQTKVDKVEVERVYRVSYRTANGKQQIKYDLLPGQE